MPANLLRQLANLRRRAGAARRLRVRRHQRLTANSAVFLVFTAGSIVIYYGGGSANPSGIDDDHPAFAPLAFLLYLLGIWLLLLALVAERFPRAATVGEAVARAFRVYFFGDGGN